MRQLIKRILKHLYFKKKIKKLKTFYHSIKCFPKHLYRFIHFVWIIFTTNIESASVVFLRVAMTIVLLIAGLYLYDFTVNSPSNNAVLNSSNIISNEDLLALLSLLIAFAGLLAYIFHHLIKDSLHKELKTMAHDERLASKTEMQLTSSNVFSKLYEITKKIKDEDKDEATVKTPALSVIGHTGIFTKKQLHDPCRVYEVFEDNDFLYKAIIHDILATQLIKQINNKNDYIDLSLKVLNNRSYNICLKYELWEVLTEGLEDKAIKELVKEYKAKDSDIEIEVDDEEIRLALKARQKLQKAITNEIFYLYKDITRYHIKSWKNTCEKIDELTETSPRWKKIQNKIHKYDD